LKLIYAQLQFLILYYIASNLADTIYTTANPPSVDIACPLTYEANAK